MQLTQRAQVMRSCCRSSILMELNRQRRTFRNPGSQIERKDPSIDDVWSSSGGGEYPQSSTSVGTAHRHDNHARPDTWQSAQWDSKWIYDVTKEGRDGPKPMNDSLPEQDSVHHNALPPKVCPHPFCAGKGGGSKESNLRQRHVKHRGFLTHKQH